MPSPQSLQAFIESNLQQVSMQVESLLQGEAVFLCETGAGDIGYDGAVAGPAIMKLADTAFYLLLLSELGFDSALAATNLNFDFLRKLPAHSGVRIRCELVKKGKRLLVARMTISAGDDSRVAAIVTGTYMRLQG